MTLHGHVQNGAIVLDELVELPEGAKVLVEVLSPQRTQTAGEARSLYERLKPVIGIVDDLPADFAQNHDRYLHGKKLS